MYCSMGFFWTSPDVHDTEFAWLRSLERNRGGKVVIEIEWKALNNRSLLINKINILQKSKETRNQSFRVQTESDKKYCANISFATY